ncbi:glycosyltransferase family 9 protein, partial [Acinetobacter baumannii]|uniref:glycosyltransferase family 9 protein n=1 Tax=Acinetobacter baumannii TaxID=470 RepID=UPI003329254E
MADVKNALRAEHYAVGLDIQGLMRSAMVARWAGVPATGYSWGTAREPIASLAY